MAALTANTAKVAGGTILSRPGPKSMVVKNAVTPYQGTLLCVEKATGNALPNTGGNDQAFVGIALQKVVGDGTLQISVMTQDIYVQGASVTGLTAQTKVPQPVYLGTDDNTLTLTRPTTAAMPVGVAVLYTSSGVGDVYIFGQLGAAVLGLAGGCKRRHTMASTLLAGLTNSWVEKITMWGHGLIKEFGFMPTIAASTAAKAHTSTLDIAGTNVTGGALALTTAGLNTAGTAQKVNPTALNEFFDGQVVTATGSATTAFIEGQGYFYMDIEWLP